MRVVERGWHRPHDGRVDRWISVVVALATVATLALVNLGFRAVPDPSAWWICLYLDVVFTGALVALWAAGPPLALALYIALLLPLFHIIVGAAAWLTVVGLHVQPLHRAMPVDHVPNIVAACVVGGAIVIGGVVATRNRRDTWRSIASVAIASLLLLGLWTPIAVRWVAHDVSGSLAILAPPFVVATLYSAIAARCATLIRTLTPAAATVIAVIAVPWLCEALDYAPTYANFLPWLLATAICAIAAITALVLSTHHRAPSREAIEGYVIADEAVAGFVLHSWLRGPEPYLLEHRVQTARGIAHVPASTRFIAPLAPSTTILRAGECVPLVHPGDRVRLVGFVVAGDGSPFRDAQALVAGDDATVHSGAHDPSPLDQLVLASWRPAIAYLVSVLATCGPALAAAGRG